MEVNLYLILFQNFLILILDKKKKKDKEKRREEEARTPDIKRRSPEDYRTYKNRK
jgi:hypothetical protein